MEIQNYIPSEFGLMREQGIIEEDPYRKTKQLVAAIVALTLGVALLMTFILSVAAMVVPAQ